MVDDQAGGDNDGTASTGNISGHSRSCGV